MSNKMTKEVEQALWLARIIDDLNPDDFGSKEFVQEFASLGREDNDEKYVRKALSGLVNMTFVEKIAQGRYRVTDAGRQFRDRINL